MSDLAQALLIEGGQQLRVPGQLWADRLVPEQQNLVRSMASLCNRLTTAQRFSALAAHGAAFTSLPAFEVLTFAPRDLIVQGPSGWGYDPDTGAPRTEQPVPSVQSSRRPWLLTDGRVVESAAGDPLTLPESELHEQTVWFVPNPYPFSPTLLWSAHKSLAEGSGFLNRGTWLVLFENPLALWPDGCVPCMAAVCRPSWRSGALRADGLYGTGRLISRYQRAGQTPKALELALCEIAGLPVLETEGVVARMESAEGLVRHWLEDGRQFVLPGSSPYSVGSPVPANDGHILHIRCQATRGDQWWANRYWGSMGIPIHIFRPGFYGFAIRDQRVPVEVSETDGLLRARLIFQQNEAAEETYWEWQEDQEDRLLVETWATACLGIDQDEIEQLLQGNGLPILQADGDPIFVSEYEGTVMRNPLEVFAGVCGPWLGVVETSLDAVDPVAYRRVMDYAERERPSGMLLYFAGQGPAYTNEALFDEYVQTGELQLDTVNPLPCRPPH